MISNRSQLLWDELAIVGVVMALASCSSSSTTMPEPAEIDEPGSIKGELVGYVADDFDGTSETSYFLRDKAGNERLLRFHDLPDISPGETVRVWGTEATDAFEVKTIKLASKVEPAGGSLGSTSSELIGQPARAPRLVCPITVSVSGGSPPTNDAAMQAWITGPKSVSAYMLENSYGQDSFIANKSYGPLTYAMTGCDTSGLANALRGMIPAADGCQHYVWVMSKVSACPWGGLGQIGTSDKPAKDTWYNNDTACVAAVQELGHNRGGAHSSAITCSDATAASGGINDTLAGCTHSEYGDRSDTFGGGCRHMNAWQKLYQKWWGGAAQGGPAGSCNAVKVASQGTFTFNLYPTEVPCNGVQAIQIPFPGAKNRAWQNVMLTSWYLEFRAPLGAFDGSPAITPQVQARLGVDPVQPTQMSPRGVHVWIPNIGSANMSYAAGSTFTDPAGGMTVKIDSIDMTKAVVTITLDGAAYPAMTGPTCIDGANTPFQAPGPTDCTTVVPPADGGVTGAGGKGGAGGNGGAGGKGGAGGVGGKGGTAGAGGTAGNGGAGGVGGSGNGGGGDVGGAGGNGQAGSGIAGSGQAGNGNAGSGQAGSGQAGATGTAGRPNGDPGNLDGGCACRIETMQRGSSRGALLGLALAGLFASRRRRKLADARRFLEFTRE